MTDIMTKGISQWVVGLVALGALSVVPPGALRLDAQTPSSVSGQGYAAVVRLATATHQFADAVLPGEGGMAHADLDNATMMNALSANALNAITTGMVGDEGASSQTSAEAADVSILDGLVTAQQVVAVASSYATTLAAASDATGSTLLGLVVSGVSMGDVTPAPNMRVNLPGVGYVVLNEQAVTGDGWRSSGIAVNMIHVYVQDAVTGVVTGEIVVGGATSGVEL